MTYRPRAGCMRQGNAGQAATESEPLAAFLVVWEDTRRLDCIILWLRASGICRAYCPFPFTLSPGFFTLSPSRLQPPSFETEQGGTKGERCRGKGGGEYFFLFTRSLFRVRGIRLTTHGKLTHRDFRGPSDCLCLRGVDFFNQNRITIKLAAQPS